jgi:hypothetical protein
VSGGGALAAELAALELAVAAGPPEGTLAAALTELTAAAGGGALRADSCFPQATAETTQSASAAP